MSSPEPATNTVTSPTNLPPQPPTQSQLPPQDPPTSTTTTMTTTQPSIPLQSPSLTQSHTSTTHTRKASLSHPTTTTTTTTEPNAVIPLDSPLRTHPLSSEIPQIKLPLISAESQNQSLNPLTLQPFTDAELNKYQFEKVRDEVLNLLSADSASGTGTGLDSEGGGGGGAEKTKKIAERLRDEALVLLKEKLDERDRKHQEIQRLMDDKEKMREFERRVYRKRMGTNVNVSVAGVGIGDIGGRGGKDG